MTRIIIADGLAKEGIANLKTIRGCEISEHAAIERDELKKILGDHHILIVRSRTQVDRDLLEYARNLRVVVRAGIGLDNVDIQAATDRGVIVMNAPTGNIVTTAEHAVAMMCAMSRFIPQADQSIRQGKWEKKKFQGHELRGKTLGLLGLGNIGKVVAQRGQAMEMKVVAYDPYISPQVAAQFQVNLVEMDELLKTADYLSVHVPLTDSTRHLLNYDRMSKMKKGSYLINCARGGIVDEAALVKVLDEKILAGAALDVFETEPLPADHFLLKRSDIILTPHLGASTDEAQLQVGLEVASQIEDYLEKGTLKNAFNVPNLNTEQLENVKPYLSLCENMGSFLAQSQNFPHIEKLVIEYRGIKKAKETEVLTLSVLRGFLTPLTSTDVNFVNVKNLFKNKGIKVEEMFSEESENFHQLIRIHLKSKEDRVIEGTLFGKKEPRLLKIDQFEIDASLSGCLLFIRNLDQPGVIGAIGSELGQAKVNIAHFHLGRNSERTEAVSLVSIDGDIHAEVVDKLKKLPAVLDVRKIRV